MKINKPTDLGTNADEPKRELTGRALLKRIVWLVLVIVMLTWCREAFVFALFALAPPSSILHGFLTGQEIAYFYLLTLAVAIGCAATYKWFVAERARWFFLLAISFGSYALIFLTRLWQ